MVDYSIVEMTPSEIEGSGPRRRAKPPSIFLAFRMDDPKGKRFRAHFEENARHYRPLALMPIVDGRVPIGANWASTVRDRIRRSRLVVADITGPSKEVLFEAGFAFGLRKPVLPVVVDVESRRDVPRWLTPIQIGTYESDGAIARLLADVARHVTREGVDRPPRPPDPTPGSAVWLRIPTWAEECHEQFEATARQKMLSCRTIDVPQAGGGDELADDAISVAASANYLFACLDGTKADRLVHYVCGAIVARPRAGGGDSKLERRIRFLVEPGQTADDLVADSARKCAEVRVVSGSDVLSVTKTFMESYAKWAAV